MPCPLDAYGANCALQKVAPDSMHLAGLAKSGKHRQNAVECGVYQFKLVPGGHRCTLGWSDGRKKAARIGARASRGHVCGNYGAEDGGERRGETRG